MTPEAGNQSRGRVLVIDDQHAMTSGLMAQLHQAGFRPEAAASGAEGLNALVQGSHEAVLLNPDLPGMHGREALEQLAVKHREVPVIVHAASGVLRDAVESMRQGAFDYLVRPADIDQLVQALDRAVEHARRRSRRGSQGPLATHARHSIDQLVGVSPMMQQLRAMITRVANSDISVLIVGESGTGKEVVARCLVAESRRADRPLFTLNCAALPPSLIESELFGHERGAFTGADQTRAGFFEIADGGTLFLDEITEMPFQLQAKLLRVLQFQEFRRIGGSQMLTTNVRVLAATNRNPREAIEAGQLRSDLHHRLAAITLSLTPLRERPEDIQPIAEFILRERLPPGTAPPSLTAETLACLRQHPWPGNVRELENALLSASILCEGGVIRLHDLPAGIQSAADRRMTLVGPVPPDATLREIERHHILGTLERCNGNKAETARRLGITKRTLYNKLIQYGVHRAEAD